jgi:hypothetical protein
MGNKDKPKRSRGLRKKIKIYTNINEVKGRITDIK